jgi:hypothetical protein
MVLVLCAALGMTPAATAQHGQGHGSGQNPTALETAIGEPIPLYKTGLGPFTRPISSANPEAQAYFDQGFQLMYAFAKLEAARSFR